MAICEFTICLSATRGDGSIYTQALSDCIWNQCFHFVCMCAYQFNSETKGGKGREWYTWVAASIMTWPSSRGTMVRPFVWHQKSGGSLLAWCRHGLMTGSCSGRGQVRWDRPFHPPCWWLQKRERGREMVGDGANNIPKPHRYYEGQDFLYVATFYLKEGIGQSLCVRERKRKGVRIMVLTIPF